MINLHIKEFEFSENIDVNSSILLVIENKKLLYSFLKDLCSGSSYLKYFELYDDSNKKIKTTDVIDFIPSLLTLDLNNKKNINSLMRNVKILCNDNLESGVEYIKNKLEEIYNYVKMESTLDIVSDINFDEDDLMKYLGIKLVDNDEVLVERVLNYIKASIELRGVRVFVFYGLVDLLDSKELYNLLKNVLYLGVKIIDIESKMIDKNQFTSKYLIDNDLCLIK